VQRFLTVFIGMLELPVVVSAELEKNWQHFVSRVLYCIMFGAPWSVLNPNCTRYSTDDAVGIGNSFYYNFNHVTTITIIYYAVTRLHNYKPYTFVTTVTYYTLALADFSAISYCLKLSHTLHLHASKLSPRSHSANSPLLKRWLLRSHSRNWTELAKSSAYKPLIVLAARAVLRHRVYSSVASEASALPCDVIAAVRRRLRLPSPPRSVYSVAIFWADAA
jgi:hypothetical protein